jgi:hypothetical protein
MLKTLHAMVQRLNDHILPPGVKIVPYLDRDGAGEEGIISASVHGQLDRLIGSLTGVQRSLEASLVRVCAGGFDSGGHILVHIVEGSGQTLTDGREISVRPLFVYHPLRLQSLFRVSGQTNQRISTECGNLTDADRRCQNNSSTRAKLSNLERFRVVQRRVASRRNRSWAKTPNMDDLKDLRKCRRTESVGSQNGSYNNVGRSARRFRTRRMHGSGTLFANLHGGSSLLGV